MRTRLEFIFTQKWKLSELDKLSELETVGFENCIFKSPLERVRLKKMSESLCVTVGIGQDRKMSGLENVRIGK